MKKHRIGLFGGSFNPVHTGHLILADFVLDKLALEKMIFIPTFRTPGKDELFFSPEERLDMLNLVVPENPHFEVSDIEIQKKEISYTYFTLEFMKNKYPDSDLYYIIGMDNFLAFNTWYKYETLLKTATFVVLPRNKQFEPSDLNQNFINSGDFIFLDAPIIDINSTEIRNTLSQQHDIKYLVPDKVYEYLKKNRRIS